MENQIGKKYTVGKDALKKEDVQLLLSKITHLEDEALLRLAISTGIRREDIVSIQLASVDLEGGKITFWESKKRRNWEVHIGGVTLKILEQHINKLPTTKWLFPSPRGPKNHLSGKTAYNILQKYLKIAGLKSIPFHALRSTCIKSAQRSGWTPEQVSEQTGDLISTIQKHYSTPSDEEMKTVAREKPI